MRVPSPAGAICFATVGLLGFNGRAVCRGEPLVKLRNAPLRQSTGWVVVLDTQRPSGKICHDKTQIGRGCLGPGRRDAQALSAVASASGEPYTAAPTKAT